jgi:hypothetical protein
MESERVYSEFAEMERERRWKVSGDGEKGDS